MVKIFYPLLCLRKSANAGDVFVGASLLFKPHTEGTLAKEFDQFNIEEACRILRAFGEVFNASVGLVKAICRIREERALQAPCLALNHQASSPPSGFSNTCMVVSTSTCWQMDTRDS